MSGLVRGARIGSIACALTALGCADARPAAVPGNLLHGKRPSQVTAVADAERLSDGRIPVEGDAWHTDLSAVFGRGGRLVYDLGAVTPIDALLVSGDNNDRFFVAVSDDGERYRPLWEAEAVPRAGMRVRSVRGLAARARYLRVTARGGDAAVSAGELMAFGRAPAAWPPQSPRARGSSPYFAAERGLVALCAALALLLVFADRRLPRAALALAGGCVLVALATCAPHLAPLWPPPQELVSTLRALLAALASLGVLVWTFLRPRPRVVPALLSFVAVASLLCFYNFGRPWFWNEAERRPTPVHTFDMRVYFPVSKYFAELGFDGVYLASVRAYLQGERLPESEVDDVELRDLRDHRMVRAREVMDDVAAVERRFTPARWQSFVADMRFFWRTMGRHAYLGSLRDHGGNATPAWLSVTHLLFRDARATELNLTLAALLDPLLLLVTLAAIARAFGLRTMLVCAVVFGTSDFPMFGSNWAGSTLRFDWMAAVGLGACALRSGLPALGGGLLAYAALARAFPALALVFAALPALIALVEARARGARALGPTSKPVVRELLRMLAGAAATALLLVALSSALFGWGAAWGGWLQKIAGHADKPNTNHVGVRMLLSYDPAFTSRKVLQPELPEPWTRWQETQTETYARRAPLALALRLLFCALCLLACRGARPEQAALIGLLLVPVLFYPANYYLHYVFLLPLLAAGVRFGVFLEVVLLSMAVAQLFTLTRPVDVRFFWQSAIVLVAYAALLVPLALLSLRSSAERAQPTV